MWRARGRVARLAPGPQTNLHSGKRRADRFGMASQMDATRARAIPITRIEEAEVREWIRHADVIYGFDTASDGVGIFFGREIIEDIAKGRQDEFDAKLTLAFTLRFGSQELEALCATVQDLKGRHTYKSTDESAGDESPSQ